MKNQKTTKKIIGLALVFVMMVALVVPVGARAAGPFGANAPDGVGNHFEFEDFYADGGDVTEFPAPAPAAAAPAPVPRQTLPLLPAAEPKIIPSITVSHYPGGIVVTLTNVYDRYFRAHEHIYYFTDEGTISFHEDVIVYILDNDWNREERQVKAGEIIKISEGNVELEPVGFRLATFDGGTFNNLYSGVPLSEALQSVSGHAREISELSIYPLSDVDEAAPDPAEVPAPLPENRAPALAPVTNDGIFVFAAFAAVMLAAAVVIKKRVYIK